MPSVSILLPLLTVLTTTALNAQQPRCIALGVGAWGPSEPGAIWTASRTAVLTPAPDSHGNAEGAPDGWWEAHLAAESPVLFDLYWTWRRPTADSLQLRRVAALSEGIIFTGTWKADTLLGRAHAYSDAIHPGTPRANAYGVRFSCKSRQAEAKAYIALEALLRADVPNAQLGAVEDSVWLADIDRRLRKASQAQ